MPPDRQELGQRGERAAERWLAQRGMRVVERRFRRRSGEIDLIVVDGDTVVFVEVKARRGRGYGAAEAVTPLKCRRIARTALAYLVRQAWLDRRCRFDVVEVFADAAGRLELRHFPDAFRVDSRLRGRLG